MTTHTNSPDFAFVPPVNFVECLRCLAASMPDKAALVVVAEQGGELVETIMTYRAFDQHVRALAALLQSRFIEGDRILLLLDNDQYYAISMFACFYSGLIAVPVFPPESTRAQHLERLTTIAVDARAKGILTISTIGEMVGRVAAGFGISAPISVDEIDVTTAGDWRPHNPSADDVAFLQYTSGSTSAPKGVMVTHDNLMANECAIREAMSIGADDKLGVWSPLFHDMGMIGGLLQPFYSGIPCVLCSPRFFLERPVRWLELISRHGITISGGPDFAYRLCLERVSEAQLDGLDLSSWRVAYTGAEPVRHDTMEAFIERYAPVGFNAGAVYACYGLAEATLLVTGGHSGSGMAVHRFDSAALSKRMVVADSVGVALVGCGRAPSAHELRIIDPVTGEPAAEGAIGEIWAAGPSITKGYWNKSRETAEAFVECDDRRWLRTGDLGFEHGGELFVAGRLKDMIIVRGHNLYPQDIERAIEADVEAVRKGRVAAFAVDFDGEEGIGLAVEVSRGLQKLIAPQALVDALSVVVSDRCGEAPAVVILLNSGALPKTSSGKLQRSACRNGWKDKSLDAYAIFERGQRIEGEDAKRILEPILDDVMQELASIWREVLKHDAARQYAGDANFLALGGNSLAAVQLASHVARQWKIDFSPRLVFENPRLQEQVAAIRYCMQTGVRVSLPSIPVLSERRRAEPIPLSAPQRRQWFLWRLNPQSTAYHVQGALRISGALDVKVMREAVAALAQKHEALRTLFRARPDGEVEQLVDGDGSLDLQQIDLGGSNHEEIEARLAETLRALNAQPFDLTLGPLVRAALIRLDDRVHVLALVMHHVVSDGASMQIIVDELGALYSDRLAGNDVSTLPPPAIQYTDYAIWQHDQLDKESYERQLTYWRKQLEVAPGEAQPVLALPTDHPRQPVARYRAAQHCFEMPNDLVMSLRHLAEVHGVTLFTVLLAAFYALLYRYTGQHDIRVGVPVANRGRPELQGVVGFFVNTLVLRNVIDGHTSLAQVLDRTREAALGAQANQDLPFEQLVEALQPERSLSHSPLFQVIFNHLQDDLRALQRLSGCDVSMEATEVLDAQFELSVDVRERSNGGIFVSLVYAVELFDALTITRFGSHYLAMLNAFANRLTDTVGKVDLLTGEERSEIASWSRSDEVAAGEIVHHLFERQVVRSPNATALCVGDTLLSYAELNTRANRLAHRLVAMGVAPDTPVGIAMERSVEMVVGLLGIMKAGGAYVPIDPEYPSERIAYMLQDSGVTVLLTQRHLSSRLGMGDVSLLELDVLDLDAEPDHNPDVPLHGENLVYVIYTSGSTGRPKGAANRHRSLCNRLAWGQRHQPLDSSDTVLQKTPFSFDISFWEFFWPLTAGARLALAGPGEHRDPQRLVALIERHGVTTIHFVPSMLQAFMDCESARACAGLRRIICSGEALPAELQSSILDTFPSIALLNLYGPTEAAIEVTWWECRAEGALTVPIGRPLSDLRAHVLDEALNEVPRGVAGELHLGGLGLARGYWQRSGLTADRFVADPACTHGGRLYRTGDLVRWRGDGQLEYLGRIDHQVKIRGFRIELGEVEAQLRLQPSVREAVVVAHAGSGGAQLVAYVSPVLAGDLDTTQLKAALTTVLPDYMVPSLIMVLDELPLNTNGKVDRKALPVPTLADRAPCEAPKGKIGEMLAAIWAEVLGVEKIGANDNFFDLGGHSLQLIRVYRLLEDRLNTDLSVVDLFKYPTVDALEKRIKQGAGEEAQDSATCAEIDAAQRRRQALLQRKRHIEGTV